MLPPTALHLPGKFLTSTTPLPVASRAKNERVLPSFTKACQLSNSNWYLQTRAANQRSHRPQTTLRPICILVFAKKKKKKQIPLGGVHVTSCLRGCLIPESKSGTLDPTCAVLETRASAAPPATRFAGTGWHNSGRD